MSGLSWTPADRAGAFALCLCLALGARRQLGPFGSGEAEGEGGRGGRPVAAVVAATAGLAVCVPLGLALWTQDPAGSSAGSA